MTLQRHGGGGIKDNKDITVKYDALSGVGCWLGDGVYSPSGCEAYILCDGDPNVECTEFDASLSEYDIRLLKVVDHSCSNPISSSIAYLEYYNGTTWVLMNSFTQPTYYGWSWVGWTIYPSGWIGRFRIRWAGCTKEWSQVLPPPILTSIVISPTNVSIGIGDTEQLSIVCKDQNNNVMSCPTLTWTSSNASVATVNQSGLVTGVAEGSTNITASAEGKTSNISTVTVTIMEMNVVATIFTVNSPRPM